MTYSVSGPLTSVIFCSFSNLKSLKYLFIFLKCQPEDHIRDNDSDADIAHRECREGKEGSLHRDKGSVIHGLIGSAIMEHELFVCVCVSVMGG